MTDQKELPELTDEEICDYSALYYTGSAIHYVRKGMKIYRKLIREKMASQFDLRAVVEKTRVIEIRDEKLSKRVRSILRFLGVRTLEDLLRFTKSTLIRTRNLGRKSMTEIEEYLSSKGYRLGMLAPMWIGEYYDSARTSDGLQEKNFASQKERDEFIKHENKLIREKFEKK